MVDVHEYIISELRVAGIMIEAKHVPPNSA